MGFNVAILPVVIVTKDRPISPGSRLTTYNFYRDASTEILQLVKQWLNFTYSRIHTLSAMDCTVVGRPCPGGSVGCCVLHIDRSGLNLLYPVIYNSRGCQSDSSTWSAEQEKIEGTSTKKLLAVTNFETPSDVGM